MKNGIINGGYVSPQAELMELQVQTLIAASDQFVVTNPWEGNYETDL